jgi:hypothetical protein
MRGSNFQHMVKINAKQQIRDICRLSINKIIDTEGKLLILASRTTQKLTFVPTCRSISKIVIPCKDRKPC